MKNFDCAANAHRADPLSGQMTPVRASCYRASVMGEGASLVDIFSPLQGWDDIDQIDLQSALLSRSSPLRIIHTEAAMTFGGQEHRIYKEMLAMRARGHYLEAVCQPGAHLTQRLQDKGFRVHEVAMNGVRNFVCGVRSIAGIIKRGNFDVVNTHSRTDTMMAATAGRLVRAPLIVRTRHLAKMPGSLMSYTTLPHRVIAISEYVRGQMLTKGVPEKKIGLVYTAVELPEPLAVSTLRAELKLACNAVVIGSVGHMRTQKGHSNLIMAAEPLLRQDQNLHLVIAGRGEPLLSQLRDAAQKKGLAGQVHLLGQRNDVPNLLRGFDIFALATEIEALGTSFIEAASYGLPLVATNVGGVPEIISSGRNGLLVELGSVEQLTDALRTLVNNPELRKTMGQEAKKMIDADKRWSVRHMAETTESVYRQWLGETARS